MNSKCTCQRHQSRWRGHRCRKATTSEGSGATLLDALTSGEHGVEALARQVEQSIDVVQHALLWLELSGQVVRLPGQRYARAN